MAPNKKAEKRKPNGQFEKGHAGGPGRPPLARTLAQLVRDVGEEIVDHGRGWTRLEAMIRRLYADALGGKNHAAELLLDRGWGRVPLPVQLDASAELTRLLVQHGLTSQDVAADPLARELFALAGVVIDEHVTPDE